MFRHLQIATAAAAALLLCTFPLFAKARTAWVWTTDGRPFSFLLAFALGALALETLLLPAIAPGQKKTKVLEVLCLGNLVTFLLPYLLRYLGEVYEIISPSDHYVVGVLFLVVLLVLEVPVEYNLLHRDDSPNPRLLAGLLVANAVSTAGIALLERLAFHGYWHWI